MISFRQILRESGHLYRAVGLTELYKVLNANALFLKFAEGVEFETSGKQGRFFLSLARVKYGTFARGGNPTSKWMGANIVLVLDGDLLRSKYRVRPVDFWSGSGDHHYSHPPTDKEQEERLISDKDRIPGANKYIMAIHIYVDSDQYIKHGYAYNNRMLHDVEALAKRRNIPLFFYGPDQAEAFRTQQTSKASPNLSDIVVRQDKTERDQEHDKWSGSVPRTESRERHELRELLRLYRGLAVHDPEHGPNVRYKYKYDYNGPEAAQHLENLLHNNRTRNWPEFQQLADLMRRDHLANIRAFTDKILEKLRSKDL